MRVVITGGGTGGHVYPALAVAEALARTKAAAPLEVLYVGSASGMEEAIVRRAGLPFRAIAAGPLRGKSPVKVVDSGVRMAVGLAQSWRLLAAFGGEVVLATGGYVCAPVVLAARLRRIPSAIYLPDVEPGWAVRFLSQYVDRVAVTSARSRVFLPPAKVVETGYPVRRDLAGLSREEAGTRLALPSGRPVLLVWGGSRGARSINQAVAHFLPELLRDCEVMHISGSLDVEWLAAEANRLPADLKSHYHLHAYLHDEFAAALVAADLVVSRAGASVLGEFPMAGLPAILVPYPYAGAHQAHNARLLVEAGAAVHLANDRLGELLGIVGALVGEPERLAGMRAAAKALARPQAAERIAGLVAELGSRGSRQPWEMHSTST